MPSAQPPAPAPDPPEAGRGALFDSLVRQKMARARQLAAILDEAATTPAPAPPPALTFEAAPAVAETGRMRLFKSLVAKKREDERRLAAVLGSGGSVVEAAREAVDRRRARGSVRSSPEVWAAVRSDATWKIFFRRSNIFTILLQNPDLVRGAGRGEARAGQHHGRHRPADTGDQSPVTSTHASQLADIFTHCT